MEMIRVSKSTIDSLVCFYFGITLDGKNEKENNIIRRLAERAFIDATNQGAFNTKANKVPLEEKNKAREEAIDIVVKRLKNYNATNSREEFKKWHEESCNEIKNAYKTINEQYCADGDALFSYGNVQKLLNMTIKYIYLLGTINGYDDLDKSLSVTAAKLLKDEMYLDIPIDSFIIQAFWEDEEKKYDEIIELILKDDWKNKWTESSIRNKKRYSYSVDKYKPWSTWSQDLYYQVSDKIYELIDCPIKWECDAWIGISKKRKGW